MAGSKRLQQYGEWTLIDSVCKSYNYTHEQVFKLSWSEVMTMIAYNRELGYVEAKSAELKKAAKKS